MCHCYTGAHPPCSVTNRSVVYQLISDESTCWHTIITHSGPHRHKKVGSPWLKIWLAAECYLSDRASLLACSSFISNRIRQINDTPDREGEILVCLTEGSNYRSYQGGHGQWKRQRCPAGRQTWRIGAVAPADEWEPGLARLLLT